MGYPEAKDIYLAKGWTGPLPLPARAKKSPPDGFTGKDGRWPNDIDFAVWDEQFADGNTCIRLPDEVVVDGSCWAIIGIDEFSLRAAVAAEAVHALPSFGGGNVSGPPRLV